MYTIYAPHSNHPTKTFSVLHYKTAVIANLSQSWISPRNQNPLLRVPVTESANDFYNEQNAQ